MGASDGKVLSTTKIVDHKSADTGFNLVILSDGFQESEMPAFETVAQNFVDLFQITQPYNEVWDEINVYRINVSSTESGADDPSACGGPGTTAKTFFDSSFCNNGIRRLLVADSYLALKIANDNVPAVHLKTAA